MVNPAQQETLLPSIRLRKRKPLATKTSVLATMMKDQRLLPQGIAVRAGVTLVFGWSTRKDRLDATIATESNDLSHPRP